MFFVYLISNAVEPQLLTVQTVCKKTAAATRKCVKNNRKLRIARKTYKFMRIPIERKQKKYDYRNI